jgi:GNAT superfamily N-acetyltransferase
MIRRATAAEIDTLVGLINAAYVVERFFKRGDRIDARRVASLMARGAFLVESEADGVLLGCVFVEVRAARRGYFGLLAVDPLRQHGGTGRRLIAAAETFCRDAGCEAMDIRVVNLRTELPPYYERLGYVETGTAPYDDQDATRPCHFVVMSKPLVPPFIPGGRQSV